MKSLIYAVATAAVLAVPAVSFAQANTSANAPVTRAEVRAQLAQLEQAGYDPLDRVDYPENIMAAEHRLQAQPSAVAAAPVQQTSYGPSSAGASQSGRHAVDAGQSIFFGQ